MTESEADTFRKLHQSDWSKQIAEQREAEKLGLRWDEKRGEYRPIRYPLESSVGEDR